MARRMDRRRAGGWPGGGTSIWTSTGNWDRCLAGLPTDRHWDQLKVPQKGLHCVHGKDECILVVCWYRFTGDAVDVVNCSLIKQSCQKWIGC